LKGENMNEKRIPEAGDTVEVLPATGNIAFDTWTEIKVKSVDVERSSFTVDLPGWGLLYTFFDNNVMGREWRWPTQKVEPLLKVGDTVEIELSGVYNPVFKGWYEAKILNIDNGWFCVTIPGYGNVYLDMRKSTGSGWRLSIKKEDPLLKVGDELEVEISGKWHAGEVSFLGEQAFGVRVPTWGIVERYYDNDKGWRLPIKKETNKYPLQVGDSVEVYLRTITLNDRWGIAKVTAVEKSTFKADFPGFGEVIRNWEKDVDWRHISPDPETVRQLKAQVEALKLENEHYKRAYEIVQRGVVEELNKKAAYLEQKFKNRFKTVQKYQKAMEMTDPYQYGPLGRTLENRIQHLIETKDAAQKRAANVTMARNKGLKRIAELESILYKLAASKNNTGNVLKEAQVPINDSSCPNGSVRRGDILLLGGVPNEAAIRRALGFCP
jgi:hypothetical protein